MIVEHWLFFDTETTGLVGKELLPLEKQPYLTEFAGVLFARADGQWQEVKSLEFLIKPPVPITDEIERITGITNSMLEMVPPFAYRVQDIKDFFNSATHICGHNLTFDMDMIDLEFRRIGATWRPQHRQKHICTVERTEYIKGHRMSLGDLHEHCFGSRFDGAHRAMIDVRATIRCAQYLLQEKML